MKKYIRVDLYSGSNKMEIFESEDDWSSDKVMMNGMAGYWFCNPREYQEILLSSMTKKNEELKKLRENFATLLHEFSYEDLKVDVPPRGEVIC